MRSLITISALLASFVVFGFVSSAQASGLSTYYSDVDKNYSASASKYVYDYSAPEYSLCGNFSTRQGDIEWASTQWSATTPNIISVYMNFNGRTGTDPTDTFTGSQSSSSLLNGYQMYQNVSTGFYNTGGGKGGMTSDGLGEDWAYGSASLDFYSKEEIEINGNAFYGTNYVEGQTYYNYGPSWAINFGTSTAAADFGQMLSAGGAMEVAATPEPMTMSLLVIGGIMTLIRRRRQ